MNIFVQIGLFLVLFRSGITRSHGDVFEYSGADNFIKEFLAHEVVLKGHDVLCKH